MAYGYNIYLENERTNRSTTDSSGVGTLNTEVSAERTGTFFSERPTLDHLSCFVLGGLYYLCCVTEPSRGRGAPDAPEPLTLLGATQYLTRYNTRKKFVRATPDQTLCELVLKVIYEYSTCFILTDW